MPILEVKGRKPRVTTSDGHGYETSGKETPPLPQRDGKRMKEKEFNEAVQNYLAEELKRCGVDHKDVAPGRTDIPLADRAKASNVFQADLHIDIHANAFNGVLDDKAGGLETLYYKGSSKSLACAKIVHKHVMEGTKMKDRGLKDGSWLYMLKHTHAPSLLVELGFMDNKHDVDFLLSESYRKECAVELAKAICEIFGISYVPKAKPAVKPAPKKESPSKEKSASEGHVYYRVVAGSYKSREEAEAQQKRLKDKLGIESFLLPYKPE